MFEKQYRDEQESSEISVKQLRTELEGIVKSVDVAIEAMTENPGEWVVRSLVAVYRFLQESPCP